MGNEEVSRLSVEMANSLKPNASKDKSTCYDLFYSGIHEAPMLPWADDLNDLQLAGLGIDVYLYRKGLTQV